MHQPAVNSEIMERLQRLELLIIDLKRTIDKLQDPAESPNLDDWIDEKTTMKITNLGRTSLYKLRKENKVSFSRIKGKGIFYKKKDFVRILKKNELQ